MNENEENMQPQPCETQTETPQEPVKAESEKAEHGKQGKKWKEEIEKLKSESLTSRINGCVARRSSKTSKGATPTRAARVISKGARTSC